MKSTKTENGQRPRRTEASLHSRYGDIGIPAVAAAMQYKTDAKNGTKTPADAPAVPADSRFAADIAA
jgi:hypothetical protein